MGVPEPYFGNCLLDHLPQSPSCPIPQHQVPVPCPCSCFLLNLHSPPSTHLLDLSSPGFVSNSLQGFVLSPQKSPCLGGSCPSFPPAPSLSGHSHPQTPETIFSHCPCPATWAVALLCTCVCYLLHQTSPRAGSSLDLNPDSVSLAWFTSFNWNKKLHSSMCFLEKKEQCPAQGKKSLFLLLTYFPLPGGNHRGCLSGVLPDLLYTTHVQASCNFSICYKEETVSYLCPGTCFLLFLFLSLPLSFFFFF